MKHDLLLFFGRFHPLLVHLPIGGLILLGFLELVAALTRRKEIAQTSRWMVGFVSVTAAVAAAAGWMLAQDGGYDAQLLKWHRALGLALAGACVCTCVLRYREQLWAYRASLLTSFALLVAVSHLGGSITHGRDFLTRYAPASVRTHLGLAVRSTRAPIARPSMQQPVFEAVIAPILEQRCAACHGAERHKAQLRLDSIEACLRGGQDGPVIKLGQARSSPLVERMLLPLEAEGHMPPDDQPQPTAAEMALLEWWIDAGAPTTANVSELQPKAEIRRLLEVVSSRPAPLK